MEKKARILVIEDDPDASDLVKDFLEHSGYEVEVARDGLIGEKKIHETRPDLIVMDFMLPGLDGLTLCKVTKQDSKLSNIPILALTALDQIEYQERALAYGADDFLAKPFLNERLLYKIQKLLGHAT